LIEEMNWRGLDIDRIDPDQTYLDHHNQAIEDWINDLEHGLDPASVLLSMKRFMFENLPAIDIKARKERMT
jgi:hypothetical protein